VLWQTGDTAGAREATVAGLEALGDRDGGDVEVRLRLDEARYRLILDGDVEGASARIEDVRRLASDGGHRTDQALFWLGTVRIFEGRLDEAIGLLRSAIEEAHTRDDPIHELECARHLWIAYLEAGLLRGAAGVIASAVDRARGLRLRARELHFLGLQVQLDYLEGRHERAISAAREILSANVAQRTRETVTFNMACALIERGEFDEAESALASELASASIDAGGRGSFLYVRAGAEFWGGRPERALGTIVECLAEPGSDGVWGAQAGLLGAWCDLELGRDPAPPDGAPSESITVRAQHLEHQGVSVLTAEPGEAARLFAEAEQLWRRYSVARAVRMAWATGEALRRAGDDDVARTHLLEAEEEAKTFGFEPILVRVQRSLRLLGDRRTAPRGRGSGELTSRQLEILSLVADGLTNDQVASRLGLSRSTVARQISTASAKLGVSTRAQAAAAALDA
jgi:DNA-binding CsgD family transcriptional regulator